VTDESRVCVDPPQLARAEIARWLLPNAHAQQEHVMMDFLMLAFAFGMFALAIGYTYACERL
jgi:hypothetical protein